MTLQSGLHLRGLSSDEELLAAMKVFRTAMIGLPMLPRDQALELNRLNDAGRTYGAFEDDRLIGTTDSMRARSPCREASACRTQPSRMSVCCLDTRARV